MMTDTPDRKWPVGGYAPGDYCGCCTTCKGRFIGAKRAYTCADCTIQALRTPARIHAEELVALLKEALDELDEYYRAEYDTDHPYHQDKLARARDSWADARALLARIEGEASK